MPQPSPRRRFSMLEVVVVALILGFIGFNAAPRLSRGSAAVADSALAGNLTILRNGIDLYASDHNGKRPGLANFEAQLTQFTDLAGNTSPMRDGTHRFGPYLRKLPVLTVGPKGIRGASGVADAGTAAHDASAGAWRYNASTGEIRANLPDSLVDFSGRTYNQY